MGKNEIVAKKAKANKELKEVSEIRTKIENYETSLARSYKIMKTVSDSLNNFSTSCV